MRFITRRHFGMLLFLSSVGVVSGEEPAAKSKKNGRRAGLKPGEVTEPAALSERRPETLAVGDAAPDFTLKERQGERSVTLSEFREKQPVVLVFGSITCPPFRRELPQLERLYGEYGDRARFFLVYLREAHPDSVVSVTRDGKEELEKIGQIDDWATRAKHAELCATTLKLTFPALIDNERNEVRDAYAGWPSRLMVIGTDGKVTFDGGRGPRGFRPDELDKWLRTNLGEPRAVK